MIGRYSSKERIRSAAAAWVARHDRGLSGDERPKFEKWLSASPEHRAAYARSQANYGQSAQLVRSKTATRSPLGEYFTPPSRPLFRPGFAIAATAILVVGGYQVIGPVLNPAKPRLQAVMLVSGAAPKAITLSDGTAVRLGPSSRVAINLTRSERQARLEQGQIRIVIARDDRPFIMRAGETVIQAREGAYELDVRGQGGIVSKVAAGNSASIARGSVETALITPGTSARSFDFNATALGDVSIEANRQSDQPLLEIDPAIRNLPVSGIFRAGDQMSLARSLAAVFDLEIAHPRANVIRLQPRRK